MQFEGSEKKLEVVFSASVGDLRDKGLGFWQLLVSSAKAQILSSMRGENCEAYLLSESSLFVWSDRLTLITCGQTTLVEAIKFILKSFNLTQIRSLIFQRKNEYFPYYQPSNFFEDVRELNLHIDGKSLRFGGADEHHLFLYHLNKAYEPLATDRTLEVLMYDLSPETLEIFRCGSFSAFELREKTSVDKIFSGFSIDDFVFEPYGYSLNAIRGTDYYTIHVTPQEMSCYVSFETNAHISDLELKSTLNKVIGIFKPNNFDVVFFDPHKLVPQDVDGYEQKSCVEGELSCGYQVSFNHFYKKTNFPQRPVEIKEF